MPEELLNTEISLYEMKIILVIKDGKADGLGFEGTIKSDLQSFLGGPGVQGIQDILFRIQEYVREQLLTQGDEVSVSVSSEDVDIVP